MDANGSPLLHYSENIVTALNNEFKQTTPWLSVKLGMRYGNPSIKDALDERITEGAREGIHIYVPSIRFCKITGSCSNVPLNIYQNYVGFLSFVLPQTIIITKSILKVYQTASKITGPNMDTR